MHRYETVVSWLVILCGRAQVKGMLKTLPLNIKAEGYTVHVEGTMESPATDGKTITKQLDLAPNFNIVDFGKVSHLL